MKTCPVCQKFVTDQAKFCYYCGASLLNIEPPAPAPEIEPQPVEAVAEPVAETIEEPVAETVEEAVEAVEEPVMETVEETVEAVEEPVAEAVEEAVEEPVERAFEPEPVEEPVVETIEEPAPVEEPIPEPAVEPIVTPVAAPVQEPVAAPVQTPPPQTVVQATDSRSLMTTAGYIFTTILFSIPIIGLIFMIVWGCGKPKNISRKRFSLACLIMWLIGVIIFLIVAVFLLICFSDKIQGLLYPQVPPM